MTELSNTTDAVESTIASPENEGKIVGQDASQVFNPGFTMGELSGWLAFGVPLLLLLMALVEGSSYIWRPLAVIVYIVVSLFGVLLIAFANYPSNAADKYGIHEMEAALTLLGGLAVLISFSQVSRHLYLLAGGFSANQIGYWHWLRYGFSNLLESVLFDVPAIYEWNISEIKAIAGWSRTILFLFRTTIEFIVVAAVLSQARLAWKRRANTSKNNQARNYFAFILPKAGALILVGLWGVPLAIGIGAVISDGLSLASTWTAIRLGTPVVFGIWLALQSLRALWVPSVWNKLLSLAGLIGGSWIVRVCWPAFRVFLSQ